MTNLFVDLTGPGPLHRKVYAAVRAAIQAHQLRPDERVPATRVLAADLGISRTPVLWAYEQLLEEGWLVARPGSGTRVAAAAFEREHDTGRAPAPTPQRKTRAQSTARLPAPHSPDYDLQFGAADPADLPLRPWRSALRQTLRGAQDWMHRYADPAGAEPLRHAIAAHVTRARGVRCNADHIIITTGTQQALDLIARLTLSDGDRVALEDPGHVGARAAFANAGATLVPVPVDGQGIRVDTLARAPIKLLYTTPSHQCPLGATLGLGRRRAILARARTDDAWIVEDDYDGEFRFAGAPIPSLQGLDDDDRVIYLGTFSKTLMPTLRIGFAVLPAELVPRMRLFKALADGGSPTLEQLALAQFIADGHYAHHIRRVSRRHSARRDALLAALKSELRTPHKVLGAAAGLHVALRLPRRHPDTETTIAQRCAAAGLAITPLQRYAVEPYASATFLLGHGQITPAAAPAAISILAQVLRSARSRKKRRPAVP